MEVFFISRGMNEQTEKWKKYIETWFVPMPYTDKDGKKKSIGYQLNLKPVLLWGLTFPRDQKDLIISSFGFTDETSNIGWLHKSPYLSILRKLLKVKPIGEYNKVAPRYIGKEFVQFMPIGIREDMDKTFKDGTTREFV